MDIGVIIAIVVVALILLAAIAFFQTQQGFAQQLAGEMKHARVRVDR